MQGNLDDVVADPLDAALRRIGREEDRGNSAASKWNCMGTVSCDRTSSCSAAPAVIKKVAHTLVEHTAIQMARRSLRVTELRDDEARVVEGQLGCFSSSHH